MTYYERKKKMRRLEIKENLWKWILETVIILFVLFLCVFGYANSEGGMRGRRGRTTPTEIIIKVGDSGNPYPRNVSKPAGYEPGSSSRPVTKAKEKDTN